jgi:hypothetical protein
MMTPTVAEEVRQRTARQRTNSHSRSSAAGREVFIDDFNKLANPS